MENAVDVMTNAGYNGNVFRKTFSRIIFEIMGKLPRNTGIYLLF
jgi:hypothetical protein